MSTNLGVSIGRVQGQIHSCMHCRFFTRHLNLFERHVKRCSNSAGPSLSRLLPAPSVCRNYKCAKCSFVSNKAKLFLYHQRQVHGENIAVYGCNECEYASRHKNKVVRHKRLVHKVVSSPDDILALEDHSMINDSEDVMVAHVSQTGGVTDHQVGDSELTSEDDNRTFDTKENNNWCPGNQFQTLSLPSVPEVEREAAASGPSAVGDGSLQGSLQKLSGDRMTGFLSKWTLPKVNAVDGLYRCKFCRYSNPHKWKIASHMRTSHSRKTSYKCPQCNFVTERKIEWCTHKTLHSGKAVYSCNECAYQTTMKRNFERHQERHLVNGPRRCSLCSYSSTGEGAIQRHMAEYHPPSPGKGGENLPDEFEDIPQDHVAPNCNDITMASHSSSPSLIHSSTPIYCSSSPPFCSTAPPCCSSAPPYSAVLPPLSSSSGLVSSVLGPSSVCPEDQGLKGIPLIPLNSFRSFDIVQPPKSVQSLCAVRSSESRWTCSLCPLGYKRAADLNRHMKRKHGVSLKDVQSTSATGSSRSVLVNCSPLSSGFTPNSHSFFSNSSIISSSSVMSNNSITSGHSTVTSCPIIFSKEDQPLNLSLKNNVHSLDADLEQAEVLDLSTKTNSSCFHPSSDTVAHFRCKLCSFTTKKSNEFECHSLLHCSEKSHRCLICGRNYDTALDLTRHMNSVHQSSLLSGGHLVLGCGNQEEVVAAREVGGGKKNIPSGRSTPLKVESLPIRSLPKEFESGLVETLEQNQHSLMAGLSCKFCKYVGKHPADVVCHMKLHTEDKALQCPFCTYKTIWKGDMKCHLLKHHREEAKNHGNLQELLNLAFQPGDDDDNDKECKLRSFSDDSDKDNDYVDYNMNVEMNDSGFLLEAAGSGALHSTSVGEKDGNKLCKCPQCNFVCNTPLEMKNHLEQHDNLRRFMCMHCGKRSSLLWDIRKHIRRCHPGIDMMIRELSEEEAKSLPSDEGNQMIVTKDESKGATSDTKSAFAKEELQLKSLPKEDPMDVEKIAEQYANEVAAMFYGISGPGNSEINSAPVLQTWTGTSSGQNVAVKKFGRPSKSLIMNRFRPFKCSECGRRSNWRWDLNKHIRASHPSAHLIELTETEAKATFDEVLHRDIRERQQLMRMERTGGAKFKPYMCDSCGHRSNWKCDLNKHIKALHPAAQVITLDEEQAKETIADYDALHAKLLKQEMSVERDAVEINLAAKKCLAAAAVTCVTVDSHKLKRFKCSACPYRSNFRSDVGRHIRHKHDKGTSRIIVMNEREAAETLKEYMETWARKKFVSSPSKRRSGDRRRLEQPFADDFSIQQQSADGDNCKDSSSFFHSSTWLSSTDTGKGLENLGDGSDANNCLVGVNGGKSDDSKAYLKSSSIFARKKTEESGGASSMKSLSCSICPYQTSKTGLLNIHKTYHRPNGRNKYKCRYCPYYVCASRLLHQHMRLHLRGNNSTEKNDICTKDIAEPSEEVAAVTEDTEEDPAALSCQESATRSLGRTTYCCLKCPYVSSNRNDYLYHRQFHRPRNTPAFKCDQCPYWVSQKRLLAQHAKVHSQEYRERHVTSLLTPWTTCVESKEETKPVLCTNNENEVENEKSGSGNCGTVSSCGEGDEPDKTKNLPRMSGWENVKSDLENQDKFQDQCEISEHQLVDKFECRDCPFCTSNHSIYEEHLNQHGSGQKFLCSECNFSVGTLNLLRQHRKLHESKDGIPSEKATKLPNAEDDAHYNESKKAYCCDKCPYSNARRDHLLCHMKFHQIRSELQCSHCNYSVSRVHLLNQHLRVHGCGNSSTPSPSTSREPTCGGSSRLRRAKHRAEDLVPSESQTSFVVWMNQRQKQCAAAAQHLLPSGDRDAVDLESIGDNGEKRVKCVFMHNLQLQSLSPSSGWGEVPESKEEATGNLLQSQAFAQFTSCSMKTMTDLETETSSTNT